MGLGRGISLDRRRFVSNGLPFGRISFWRTLTRLELVLTKGWLVLANDWSAPGNHLYLVPKGLSRMTGDLSHETDDLSRDTGGLSHETDDLYRETDGLSHETDDLSRKTDDLYHETNDLYHVTGPSGCIGKRLRCIRNHLGCFLNRVRCRRKRWLVQNNGRLALTSGWLMPSSVSFGERIAN